MTIKFSADSIGKTVTLSNGEKGKVVEWYEESDIPVRIASEKGFTFNEAAIASGFLVDNAVEELKTYGVWLTEAGTMQAADVLILFNEAHVVSIDD